MDNGRLQTGLKGRSAGPDNARAAQETPEVKGVTDAEATKKTNKQREVQFKAAHGLLLAFFLLIL